MCSPVGMPAGSCRTQTTTGNVAVQLPVELDRPLQIDVQLQFVVVIDAKASDDVRIVDAHQHRAERDAVDDQ